MLCAFVVHWDPAELPSKVAAVEAAGARVVGSEAHDGARAGRLIRESEPDVLVTWLSRLPGHGRVTAAYVRSTPWGRALPLLFVDGDPDVLDKTKRATLEEVIPEALVVTPRTLPAWLVKVEAALDARRRPDPGDTDVRQGVPSA
jgi:hypothetical protein